MIIPIRCFTCGKVLADKWEYYKKRMDSMEQEQRDDTLPPNFDNRSTGHILDELGLDKLCCRRHMLTHVDID